MKKLLLFGVFLVGSAYATPPAWWTASGTAILTPGASANNGGPISVGQLKNVAKKAALYLDTSEPTFGAGLQIDDAVNAYQHLPTDANVATLGQLKAVAKPFYDRLLDLGFNTNQSLIDHGAPGWAFDYPWNPATPKSMNMGPLVAGQLKWVFSFDLTGFSVVDSDNDGVPDAFETRHFGNLSHDGATDSDGDGISDVAEIEYGTDWQDFFNGEAPVLTIVDGDHNGAVPSTVLAPPLTVEVSNQEGAPLAGASVGFAILSGGGSLSALTATTGTDGQAAVTLTLPATAGATVTVRARYTHGGTNFDQTFSEVVGDPNAPPALLGPETKLLAPSVTEGASPNENVITWQNFTSNATAIVVERTSDLNNWTTVATVGPTVTTATDTSADPNVTYFYRVSAHNNTP